jgi:hypothetical protein
MRWAFISKEPQRWRLTGIGNRRWLPEIAAEKRGLLSPAFSKTQPECLALRFLLQSPEHGHEQVDREQPDQDYLPESQVTRRPVIRHHLRIAIEETLPHAENVNSAQQHDGQADAEDDPQRQDRITVRVDDRQEWDVHSSNMVGVGPRGNFAVAPQS